MRFYFFFLLLYLMFRRMEQVSPKSFTGILFQVSYEPSWKFCTVVGLVHFYLDHSLHWDAYWAQHTEKSPIEQSFCLTQCTSQVQGLYRQVQRVRLFATYSSKYISVHKRAQPAYPKDGSFSGSCLLSTCSGCFNHQLFNYRMHL